MTGALQTWAVAGVPVTLDPVPDTDAQSAGATELGAYADGSFGVWEITAGVSTDVEADEVAVILSGRGIVEDLDTGAVVHLSPGTVLRMAAGVRTRWTIIEPLRKVYVVR